MTGEVGGQTAICCAAGCGKLGEFYVGGKLWAMSDSLCQRGAIEFDCTLVVCPEHRDNMPTTCEAFLTLPWRQLLTRIVRDRGQDVPNYESSEWVFAPIVRQVDEVAH